MKLIIALVVLWVPLANAKECIRNGENGYNIEFPEGISGLSINGDKIAYCAKFKISPEMLITWLNGCGIALDPLHHGGDIYESEVADGLVTILNTGKDNVVYFEITNSKAHEVYEDHIGVHRNCAL